MGCLGATINIITAKVCGADEQSNETTAGLPEGPKEVIEKVTKHGHHCGTHIIASCGEALRIFENDALIVRTDKSTFSIMF